MPIPPKTAPELKPKRFYVVADTDVHHKLQVEAYERDTDLWALAGAILTQWVNAGCPDNVKQPEGAEGRDRNPKG